MATVNKYGKIKTKRAGEATIYGTTSTGLYGYCDVLVVDLNRKAVTLRPYDTEQLHVNEISTGVTWYSRDINIATVSSTGLVTGRKRYNNDLCGCQRCKTRMPRERYKIKVVEWEETIVSKFTCKKLCDNRRD